jgi:BirA family biotin operon repressor/biotin-[acetyl-CoA-carboxylase] ligase
MSVLTPGDWGIEALWSALQPVWPGLSVELVDEIGSTNVELTDRLRRLAVVHAGGQVPDDAVLPVLLVARRQTSGRGRLGRPWLADPDSALTASLCLPIDRADWSGLSLAVGVALANALDATGQHLGLKWPNDVCLRDASQPLGRKAGGVLIEAVNVGHRRIAVIGFGLNVRHQTVPDRPTGALTEIWPEATPPAALARVMPALLQALQRFDQQGFAPFLPAYAPLDLLSGLPVATTDAQCPAGIARGVDTDGALRVQQGERVHRIVSGEVSVRAHAAELPPAPGH